MRGSHLVETCPSPGSLVVLLIGSYLGFRGLGLSAMGTEQTCVRCSKSPSEAMMLTLSLSLSVCDYSCRCWYSSGHGSHSSSRVFVIMIVVHIVIVVALMPVRRWCW